MSGIKRLSLQTAKLSFQYNAMGCMLPGIFVIGFLQVRELTVLCHATYDPGTNLSLDDISLDNRGKPCLIAVFIKRSKTNPFRKGVTLYLGATNHPVCPVTSVLSYLALRGSHPGPLFLTKEGQGLTHQSFSTLLDVVLAELKLQPHDYSTQFLHWRQHKGSSSRHPRLVHRDIGSLEERCLPKIYLHTTS